MKDKTRKTYAKAWQAVERLSSIDLDLARGLAWDLTALGARDESEDERRAYEAISDELGETYEEARR